MMIIWLLLIIVTAANQSKAAALALLQIKAYVDLLNFLTIFLCQFHFFIFLNC